MSRPGGAVGAQRRRRRHAALYAVLALLVVMVALPVTAAGPASVSSWGPVTRPTADNRVDRMASFAQQVVLDPAGGATFTETIDYRFGTAGSARHGIYRNIVVRQAVDNSNGNNPNGDTYRYFSMSAVTVQSPTGAPTGVKLSDLGSATQIRIGDANRTISGPQTYVITYHLANIMNPFPDHAEFFFNVFTADPVPKDTVTLSVDCSAGFRSDSIPRATAGVIVRRANDASR